MGQTRLLRCLSKLTIIIISASEPTPFGLFITRQMQTKGRKTSTGFLEFFSSVIPAKLIHEDII